MFTRYKFLDYLIWCLLRFILYMFLLIFAYVNYSDLPKYTLEFQEKIEEFSKLSNIHNQTYFPDDLEELEPIFTKILIIVSGMAFLAILGVKVFQFFSGLIVILLANLYYHPFRPAEVGPGEHYDTLNQRFPWIDTLLISLGGVGMIAHSFYFLYAAQCEKFLLNKEEETIYVEEEEEDKVKKNQ